MGETKLTVEAQSVKEIFEDLVASVEEMGGVVVRATADLPESLDRVLKSQGAIIFKPGEGIPTELVPALLDEDQEDVIDQLLSNSDALTRLIECLEDKGYECKKEGEEDYEV